VGDAALHLGLFEQPAGRRAISNLRAVTAWRITSLPDPARAFSGDGARTYGGRWNSRGTRVVYTADYPAAAILEQLVQTSSVVSLPIYYLFRVTLPQTLVSVVDPTTIPATWRDPVRHPVVQAIGDAWARARASLALQLPSAVAPHHVNYLVNPLHPDFPTLTITGPERFALDPRLLSPRAR
jgi:RES domain-containing protein